MARIKKFYMPKDDLFGGQSVGMRHHGASLVAISPFNQSRIVDEAIRVFRRPLARVTAELVHEVMRYVSDVYGFETKPIFVCRRSIIVSVAVLEISDETVTVALSFGGLYAADDARNAILSELALRAKFPESLSVQNGSLMGTLHMSAKVYALPVRREGVRSKTWEHPDQPIDAECEALKKLRRRLS